jgi:hypothetical protein
MNIVQEESTIMTQRIVRLVLLVGFLLSLALASQLAASPADVQVCSQPGRLTVGGTGRVTIVPSLPNRVRSYPGFNAPVTGQIPAGGTFSVTGGPFCEGGILWWQVNYSGGLGWTAEGDGYTYWLEPLSGGPTPPPPPPPPACALPNRLTVGGQGRVTPGLPNLLRSAPGTASNSQVIGQIPGGGQFAVLAGPQCGNDGRWWWRVNYSSMVGWTAEGEGSTYWTEPIYSGPAGCPGFLPSRLTAGATGRVTTIPNLPNRIRSYPGFNAQVLGQIPAGEQFWIANGPFCAENTAWWQVSWSGIVGWTAEGQGSTYWLEPIPQTGQCAGSPSSRLVGQVQGRVTPGSGSSIRLTPESGTVLATMPGGAVFNILFGPVCGPSVQQLTWYQVEYNGTVGWTAEGRGAAYWLEPATGNNAPRICSGSPPTRLVGLSQARVTIGGGPNSIRNGIESGTILGQIPEGAVFRILNGPICGPSSFQQTWWQVEYGGIVGWTVEGWQNVYYLEP